MADINTLLRIVPPFTILDRCQLAVVLENSTDSTTLGYVGNFTANKSYEGAVRYNFDVPSLSKFDIYTKPMDALNAYWSALDDSGWATKYKPSSGNGTASDPYLITSAWQLAWLKKMTIYDSKKASTNNPDAGKYNIPDVHFKLETNIFIEPGLNWEAFGASSYPFSANFDGNNKFIYGMNLINQSQGHVGFFADTDSATISNLTVKGTVYSTGGTYLAGIAGTAAN